MRHHAGNHAKTHGRLTYRLVQPRGEFGGRSNQGAQQHRHVDAFVGQCATRQAKPDSSRRHQQCRCIHERRSGQFAARTGQPCRKRPPQPVHRASTGQDSTVCRMSGSSPVTSPGASDPGSRGERWAVMPRRLVASIRPAVESHGQPSRTRPPARLAKLSEGSESSQPDHPSTG